VDNKNWEVIVYVQDKELFEKCVKWKDADTREKWNVYDEQLNVE